MVRLTNWIRPVMVCALLIAGFAIRNSDQPDWALLISALMALMCAILWAWPQTETPSVSRRSGLLLPASLFILLFASTCVPPVYSLLTGIKGGYGGALDPSATYVELIKLMALAFAFLAGFRLSQNDEDARRLIDVLLVAGAVWAFAAIVMQILDPNGVYGVVKIVRGRLTGAFSSPNSAATLFGSLSVLAFERLLSRLFARSQRFALDRLDPLYLSVFLMCMAALFMSLSRMGILATLLGLFAVGVVVMWRRLSVIGTLVTLGIGVLLGAALFAAPLTGVMTRLGNVQDDADIRTTIFRAHMDVALHQGPFGAGLGAFNTINAVIVSEQNFRELSIVQAAHNVYLQWFEETGYVGLGLLIGLNLAILVPIFLAARRRERMGGRLWGLLAAYSVFLLHGLTDYAFQEPTLALYTALLLGAGYAISSNTRRMG